MRSRWGVTITTVKETALSPRGGAVQKRVKRPAVTSSTTKAPARRPRKGFGPRRSRTEGGAGGRHPMIVGWAAEATAGRLGAVAVRHARERRGAGGTLRGHGDNGGGENGAVPGRMLDDALASECERVGAPRQTRRSWRRRERIGPTWMLDGAHATKERVGSIPTDGTAAAEPMTCRYRGEAGRKRKRPASVWETTEAGVSRACWAGRDRSPEARCGSPVDGCSPRRDDGERGVHRSRREEAVRLSPRG